MYKSHSIFDKVILFITVFFLLSDVIQAKSIAYRYGCDTLFYKGTFDQLEIIQNNIVKRLKEAYQKEDKEKLAVLSALACENMKAIGGYEAAADYAQQSIEYFEELLTLSKGDTNLRLRYDYATVLMDLAELNSFLLDNSELTLQYHIKACTEFQKWMSDVKSSKSITPINKERINCARIKLQQSLYLISLLKHDFVIATKEVNKLNDALKEIFPVNTDSHIEYAEMLHAKANIYDWMEDYEESLSLWKESLTVIEKSIGKNCQMYAYTLGKIASVYYQLNDLSTALEYLQQSHKIFVKSGHEFCVGIADCLEIGSLILMGLRQWKDCSDYLDTARAIIKVTCGEDSYRICLNELYTIYSLWGNNLYSAASKRLDNLLENKTFKNVGGNAYLNAMALSAELNTYMGKHEHVIASESIIEAFLKQTKFPNQTIVNELYIALGRAYQAAKMQLEACPRFEKALAAQREMTRKNFDFLMEEQRTLFWSRDFSRFNSILQQNRQFNSGYNAFGTLLFNAALLQKNLLLEANINLARIIEKKGSPELKEKMRLLHQMVKSDLNGEQMRLCNELELEVQNEARKQGDFVQYISTTWQDVKKNLKKNEVAVEFVCSDEAGLSVYSAEILRYDMKQPYHLSLYCADDSNLAIAKPNGEFTDYGKKVIWNEKLLSFFNSGDHVYFSPAGDLHRLPIEYMTLKDGRRIDEKYNMHRVSSTRRLVDRGHNYSTNKDIALFGGFNYNMSIEEMQIHSDNRGILQSNVKGTRNPRLWTYLPGTLEEVNTISPIMSAAGYKTMQFTRENGLEERFKALSGDHISIIHIATHGYYLPSESYDLDNTGLIFSGANNNWLRKTKSDNEMDDGILTGTEISHVNLLGTDLVVLSACQTGLGKISGEGVFGLQRAFKKAGVRSILMSLWEVDDEATQIFMSSFYSFYSSGFSKYEALRKAQKEVQKHSFHRNGIVTDGTDPFFWSAFIILDE